ncbi:MAG TPA: hypothetical protein DCS66_00220 [Flavobacteriaceae bacterium]|nr:hypothetical protein [Flavobacteriaceae bacterium]HAT63017.1 hypothetical protein [Flavobacteriaceae bacterium]|tara:strand:+ start:26137 stop:27000 length:864 start_codon:yes stop_codon:yes gene_type:complete
MKKITLLAAFFAAFAMNGQIIFSEDFEADPVDSILFTNWDNHDEDGDGNFWEVTDMFAFATGTSGAVNHPMQTLAADSDSWEGGAFSPDNYLVTKTPLNLSNSTGSSLTYTVGTYQVNGTFINDKYSIYLTDSNAVLDILAATPVVTKFVGDDCPSNQADGSESAATLTVDISAFDGQVVYLTFRHYDTTDENSVLIDDVIVDGILAVSDQNFNGFTYFVDANNQLNLSASIAMEKVALYNVLGQEVLSAKLSSNSEVIDISGLNSGVYIATVSIEGQVKSFKIVKK